jgi:MYXO-CTERM domain-containing protein
LFSGAGIANATIPGAPISTSTTTLAQDNEPANDSDNTGLWGLAGLLGLLGLAGLMRRNDRSVETGTAAPMRRGTDPRA